MTHPFRYDPQPIAKVETSWHAPWMLIGCSQQGPAHFHKGVLNADSYKLGSIGSRAWLIIADGVGSQPLAYEGSRLATAVVEAYLADTSHLPLTEELMKEAFAAAHRAIATAAEARELKPTQYATTLSAVALDGDVIAGASIGDTGIALYSLHGEGDTEGHMIPFCSATQSEEPHRTFVITDPRWNDHTTFNETIATHVKAVVLATDGADNFYLDQPPGEPQPVWKPEILHAFDRGLAALSARNFFAFFSNFLQQYEPDNHDDRTLLVAYRVPQEHTPPPPRPVRV